eukprot:Hpha_TRINITY_DN35843_c0_g1::TRINITY_DN35843_c0_g1_i1::g.84863::m.84863
MAAAAVAPAAPPVAAAAAAQHDGLSKMAWLAERKFHVGAKGSLSEPYAVSKCGYGQCPGGYKEVETCQEKSCQLWVRRQHPYNKCQGATPTDQIRTVCRMVSFPGSS